MGGPFCVGVLPNILIRPAAHRPPLDRRLRVIGVRGILAGRGVIGIHFCKPRSLVLGTDSHWR